MTADYPPLSVPAAPDYFLTLFRLDPDADDLTLSSPAGHLAALWGDAFWNPAGPLRRGLTACFPDHVSTTDFDREFPTLRGRTVGDVCRFLADRVPRPAVRPWLNGPAAGAFLTVRYQLAAAGADVSEVRPSAPLEPYLRRHPDAFGWRLHQLAPGLPFVRAERPVERAGLLGLFGGLALALAALGLDRLADGRLWAVPLGLLCLGLPLAAVVTVVGALLPPRRVALGGLVTFRDLARAVAVQSAA